MFCFLLGLGSIIVFVMYSNIPQPCANQSRVSNSKISSKHKERKANRANRTNVIPKHNESNKSPDSNSLSPIHPYYKDRRIVVRSSTNSWGQIIDRCIMPDGKRRKVIRNLRKPLFKNVTDEILLKAVVGGGDDPGPPIPFDENMEAAFIESLKNPIVISESDSEEEIAAKELVNEARENMLALIKEGHTFFDALNEHIGMQKENSAMRSTVLETVHELRESGDGSIMDEYIKEANNILTNLGATPVTLRELEESED